jgi:hypothetical protein
MNNKDEKLDRLLGEWRCRVERDPGFGAEIWQRIAAREESPWSRGGFPSIWSTRPLAGPAMAAILFLAAILGGVGAAELRVRSAGQFASVQDWPESVRRAAVHRKEPAMPAVADVVRRRGSVAVRGHVAPGDRVGTPRSSEPRTTRGMHSAPPDMLR